MDRAATGLFGKLIFLLLICIASQAAWGQMQQGYIPIGNDSLYYQAYGSGPPVVILHGGPGMDHNYLVSSLAPLGRSYRLIYYDQRGSGRSSGRIDSAAMTVPRFVEDVETVRKYFHIDRLTLLGHSWGGLLAMNYGIDHPDHLGRLMLVASTGARSAFFGPANRTIMGRMTRQDSIEYASIMGSEALAKGDPASVDRLMHLRFRSYFYDRSLADSLPLKFEPRTAATLLTIFGIFGNYLSTYDIKRGLAAIHAPTLIIHGDSDPIAFEYIEEIHQAIRASSIVKLERCGHFPFVEQEKRFMEACDRFLSSK